MISLNKDKVADVKTVHIILESLAKFHGIWLCWMNAENPIELGGLNRDALFEGKYLLVKIKAFYLISLIAEEERINEEGVQKFLN